MKIHSKGFVFLFNHHSKGSLLMMKPICSYDVLIFCNQISCDLPVWRMIFRYDFPMILFHDLPVILPSSFPWLFPVLPSFFLWFSLVFYGFPWFSHGFPMDFPGAFHPPHRRHGRPPCGRWSASRRSRRPRARPATRRPAADATDATGRWWIHGLIHGLPSRTSGNGHRNYKLLFFRIFL